jgi:uncharacterized phage protein (TIGR01671 family)
MKKFRVWDKITKSYSGGDLWHLASSGKLYYGNAQWPEGIIEWFTGLPDKNGKDVYEGDIARCVDNDDESYITTVTYSSGALLVGVNGCDYDYTAIGWAIGTDIQELEVIGNIHDNPELLEVEK